MRGVFLGPKEYEMNRHRLHRDPYMYPFSEDTKPKRKKKPTISKYANHPDYEFNTKMNRWVKKKITCPKGFVDDYKKFWMDFLKKNTTMDLSVVEKKVNKHATRATCTKLWKKAVG